MNGFTLRDVLSLVDGLIVREQCERDGCEGEKNESETNEEESEENEEKENEEKENKEKEVDDTRYGTKSNGEIRINETNATILGLALGSTFTTAMEMVGNQAVAVVLFATGEEVTTSLTAASLTAASLAAKSANSSSLAPANSANLSLASAAFLAHETDTNNRYICFSGVPALTVSDKHCTHVVDLTAWYCTCSHSQICAHLVAAAIAVRNRLVSARHRTCPSLPLGPITGALNDILFS